MHIREPPWKRFRQYHQDFFGVSPSIHQDCEPNEVFDVYFHYFVFLCIGFVFPFHGKLICKVFGYDEP